MAGKSGAESVEKYHGRADDLNGLIHISAKAFLDTVDCTKKFHWKDDLAWDRDFEESGVGTPPGGTDHLYADKVDIMFFAGHGTQNGPYFGRSDRDDGIAKPTEIRLGNIDLEWMAFHACCTLCHYPSSGSCLYKDRCGDYSSSTNVFNRWRNSFQGLHYILGFGTIAWTCGDALGKRFAQLLNAGSRVGDAWIRACKESQPYSTRTAYLRAGKSGKNTYNDHLWGHGYVSPDPRPPGIYLVYFSTPC